MRISFKVIGLHILSLSLLVSGCGDNSDGKSGSSFMPLATKDAKFAIALNLDKDQAFEIVDSYLKMASDMHILEGDDLEEAKEKIEACKKDIFACCDSNPEGLEFIERSGLRNAKLSWAVVSMEDFKGVKEEVPQPDGLCVAIGGKFDLEKFIAACQGEKDCDATFEKMELEGETAWRIVPNGDKQAKELKEANIDPYVASLGGGLALLAISRDTLAKHIRLYRKGAGKGDALDGFSAAKGELMRFHLSGIGELVKQNVPQDALSQAGKVVSDGDKIVAGLQSLTIDTKVKPDGMLAETIRLKTASEEDADTIRTLAKTGLMAAKAQLSKESEMPEAVKKLFMDIKIAGSDGVVEIQSGIASVGILAGALFPAISSAMLNAQTAAMSMRGRNLFVGIIQANTDREAAGLSGVWPRTDVDGGADAEDIAGKAHRNSTDYFNELFDSGNYGTDNWAPYVDVDVGVLSGSGVSAPLGGKKLESKNVAWIVAANVDDCMPDIIPVLISANFNPALLLRKWDGSANQRKRLPIGPAEGADKSMFGDKAIVVVRKGGSCEVIKARNLTYATLYHGQEFDLTGAETPLVYLTPTGVVEPVGFTGGAPAKNGRSRR